MPDTWKLYSKEILGYIAPQSDINQEFVAVKKIQGWLNQGLNVKQIAKKWNQGNLGECSKGINSLGVKYDSCAYIQALASTY